VVPELVRRDALVPAVEGLDVYRLMLVANAVNDDLAILLELPHDIADVLHAILVGQHGTLVDLLLDPICRRPGIFGAELCVLPFRAVAGEAFAAIRCAHDHVLPSLGSCV